MPKSNFDWFKMHQNSKARLLLNESMLMIFHFLKVWFPNCIFNNRINSLRQNKVKLVPKWPGKVVLQAHCGLSSVIIFMWLSVRKNSLSSERTKLGFHITLSVFKDKSYVIYNARCCDFLPLSKFFDRSDNTEILQALERFGDYHED